MSSLIQAIDLRRKMYFEVDDAPYLCLDVEVSTPTARGGQTLVRVKMRNLKTRAVFDRTFRASDKFPEPDFGLAPASYLYRDADAAHFMDQETFETLSVGSDLLGDAPDFLVDGQVVQIQKYNGNVIGLELPQQVELTVTDTEPGVRGDTAAGNVTKPARLETGLQVRVPLFIKVGERVRINTETREFVGRA